MRLAATLVYLSFASHAAAQGAVHVVDDDGGAGVDFTAISAAVAAASDGDTILVRAGEYDGFQVLGTGLAIVADDVVRPRITTLVEVEGVGSASTMLLRGLELSPDQEQALAIRDCAGAVWVEDCELRGGDGYLDLLLPPGAADGCIAAEVEDSSLVSFLRSSLSGGDGTDIFDIPFNPGFGAEALRASGSTVTIHGSTLSGGTGGGDLDDDFPTAGKPGGAGAVITDSTTIAIGSAFTGGAGGKADSQFIGKLVTFCANGGDGGDALRLVGGGLLRQDLTLSPGAGGRSDFAALFEGCSAGAAGVELSASGATVGDIPGTPRTLVAPSPFRAGVPATFSFGGVEGEAAFLIFGTSAQLLYVPGLDGVLLMPLTSPYFFVGLVPPGGQLDVAFSLTGTSGGTPAELLLAQATFIDLGTFGIGFSSPSSIPTLDPGF